MPTCAIALAVAAHAVAAARLPIDPAGARLDATVLARISVKACANASLAHADIVAIILATAYGAGCPRPPFAAETGAVDAIATAVAIIRAHSARAVFAAPAFLTLAVAFEATAVVVAVHGAFVVLAIFAAVARIAEAESAFLVTVAVAIAVVQDSTTYVDGCVVVALDLAACPTKSSVAVATANNTRSVAGTCGVTARRLGAILSGESGIARAESVVPAHSVATAIVGALSTAAVRWRPAVAAVADCVYAYALT